MKDIHEQIRSVENYLKMLKQSGVEHVLMPQESKATEAASEIAATQEMVPPQVESANDPKQALLDLRETVHNCTKCGELAASRTQTVFGSGHARARLVFVGEAPGFDEDLQGLPFVGKAGQLLTKMIEAIGMSRKEVFICNVLKCRPPQNRNPKPDEVKNCAPYLWTQLETIQPKLICTLGNFAAQTILGTTQTVTQLRGRIHEANGFRVICMFHPAYLLRNPDDKGKAWTDLKEVHRELNAVSHA